MEPDQVHDLELVRAAIAYRTASTNVRLVAGNVPRAYRDALTHVLGDPDRLSLLQQLARCVDATGMPLPGHEDELAALRAKIWPDGPRLRDRAGRPSLWVQRVLASLPGTPQWTRAQAALRSFDAARDATAAENRARIKRLRQLARTAPVGRSGELERSPLDVDGRWEHLTNAIVLREWLNDDSARLAAAQRVAAVVASDRLAHTRMEAAERDDRDERLSALLVEVGIEPLGSRMARTAQAHEVGRALRLAPFGRDELLELADAAEKLLTTAGTDDLDEALRLARARSRTVSSPATSPRRVVSGGGSETNRTRH